MKHPAHYIISGLIICSAFFVSCSDSERSLGVTKQSATVVLNLGLAEDHAVIHKSLFDRIFSFFVKDAAAQTAPAAFSSVTVLVTGPDIAPLEKQFTATGSITLTVPAGNLRRFEVTAHVDPADPSAAASFKGTAVANLPGGETVNVPVVMVLHETKIVIPDPADYVFPYTNQRIVQINDMTGAGWIARLGADIGFPGSFRPWSVDFDHRGRIYIANNNGTSGSDVVIRINNMNDTACVTMGSGSNSGINSVSIDRTNHYVYYATEGPLNLRRCSLDGTGDTALTVPSSMVSINGLTVGPDGMLYIVGINATSQGTIMRYNPATETELDSYTGLVMPEDVEVKKPYIYIADGGDGPIDKIVQLDSHLENPAGYGTWLNTPDAKTTEGQFWGPRRFVGIRNDALIIIDDSSQPYTNLGELISMQDITGKGWTPYGSDGKDPGEFQFFYGC